MAEPSQKYKDIIAQDDHWFEVSVTVGEKGVIVTKKRERITFGGTGIYNTAGGGEGGFREDKIISLKTTKQLFSVDEPTIGSCVSGEIDLEMVYPEDGIGKSAMIIPFVRACNADDKSEWIQKGVYYSDTREITPGTEDGETIVKIHGYDRMLGLDVDMPVVSHDYPCTDRQILNDIKNSLNVNIESATYNAIDGTLYTIEMPSGYSVRDTLGYIAALHGGNFIFNDDGELQLVVYGDIPRETRHLVDSVGDAIIMGVDSEREVVRLLV